MQVEAFASSLEVLAVLRRDGVITSLNRELGGVAAADAVGRRLSELAASAESSEAIRAAIARVSMDGSPTRVDASFPTPQNGHAWYQVSVSPSAADEALVVVAAEITARKELEERLHRAEAVLAGAQATMHFGTWEWDVAKPRVTMSDGLYRICGLSPDEHTPSYDAYLARVHPSDRPHMGLYRKNEPYTREERVFRPDGSMRYLQTWGHATLDDDGKITRLFGICQDITERRLSEVALEQRAAELARSNELLRAEMAERVKLETLLRRAQKLEAIGRLAGGVAHDFNNLLAVLAVCTSMLERSPREQSRKYIGEMRSAIEQASRMVRQLLAFGRDQAVERGRLDLDRVVAEAADMLRRLIGSDVDLVLRLASDAEGTPLYIDANRGQIEQVILNLVVNARDAMPLGGTLTIETARVDVIEGCPGKREPGPYVRLIVRDTGVGMTEDVQARMFDPFFTTKDQGKGTGLGLWTVYGVIEQSGGTVLVESAAGRGTRFAIFLPCLESSIEQRTP